MVVRRWMDDLIRLLMMWRLRLVWLRHSTGLRYISYHPGVARKERGVDLQEGMTWSKRREKIFAGKCIGE